MRTHDHHHRKDHQPEERPAEESPGAVIPFRPRQPVNVPVFDPDDPAAP